MTPTPSDLLTQAALLIEKAKKAGPKEWMKNHAYCVRGIYTVTIGDTDGEVPFKITVEDCDRTWVGPTSEAIVALHNEAPALIEKLLKALDQAVKISNLLAQHDDFRTVVDPSLMKTYGELDAFMDARSPTAPAQAGEVK